MSPDRAPSGRSPAQIADHNSRTILEALRRSGPLSRNDLASLVGLTIPGITNVTRRLLADGLIREDRHKSPGAQVPAAHYSLNPDGAFAIGARRRGDHFEAILVDLLGTIRARETKSDLSSVVTALKKTAGKSANIVGAGLAYDDADEIMPDTLTERATVTATLAEATLGKGAGDAGIAMVLIEDHVVAGLFFHGMPFAGVHGRAGRIGEMRTGTDRRLLNDVASAASFRAVGDGKRAIADWTGNAAKHLLDAIFAVTGFVAPGCVFIAGDLPNGVIEALIAEIRRLSAAREREADALDLPEIAPATFGPDSVLLGAALLPFFARLLPGPPAWPRPLSGSPSDKIDARIRT